MQSSIVINLTMTVEEEEKTRTLTFGNWPSETDSRIIKEFIANHMKDWEAELDEDGMFAYGRDVATRGAVRFKTTAQMLRFVSRSERASKIKQSDDKTIYINRDIVKPIEEITRYRQINKLIRVIIEFEGNTDGETTRK